MGRDVARAVRHGRRLAARAEAGQRPEGRPSGAVVRVVDRDREAARQRRARPPPTPRPWGGRSPRAGPARAASGHQRASHSASGPSTRPPERLGAVLAHEHAGAAPRRGPPRRRPRARCPATRWRRAGPVTPAGGAAQPLDARVEALRALGALHRVRTHACRHFGGQRGEYARGQLAAARAMSTKASSSGWSERLVHPAQQPGHGAREQGRRVHGGPEVPGGPLGAAVEAVGPVQGGLRGLAASHAGRLAAQPRVLVRHARRLSGPPPWGVQRAGADRPSG